MPGGVERNAFRLATRIAASGVLALPVTLALISHSITFRPHLGLKPGLPSVLAQDAAASPVPAVAAPPQAVPAAPAGSATQTGAAPDTKPGTKPDAKTDAAGAVDKGEVVKAAAPAPPPAASPDNPSAPDKDAKGAEITVSRHPIHTTPIQVDVNLVVVNITVTDPYDRIVTGLEQTNFSVFDEKVEQKIVAFSTEDAPISVGLIFDSSGSMSDKIEKSKEAALQFFKTSNPQDEFMLINFSERPSLI